MVDLSEEPTVKIDSEESSTGRRVEKDFVSGIPLALERDKLPLLEAEQMYHGFEEKKSIPPITEVAPRVLSPHHMDKPQYLDDKG